MRSTLTQQESQDDDDGPSILCVAGFGRRRNGQSQWGKIETHFTPMAIAASHVTYIAPATFDEYPDHLDIRPVASHRSRIVTQLYQLLAVIRLSRTNDYDAIVAFSLIPYGVIGLFGKAASGTPVHLGIIGMDLDVHANAWYGPVIRWCFRRFDSLSVAGTDFANRLQQYGIAPDRLFTVSHSVDSRFAEAEPHQSPQTDLVWVGRMSEEKDPIRFVRIVDILRKRGIECQAVMVGDGPLFDDVREAISKRNLSDAIRLEGWSDDPLPSYRDARVLVSTSSREMLPLTVVEAMCVGLPAIVPPLGGLPDIIDSGHNGILVPDRDPETYASVISGLLADESRRQKLGTAARQLAETHAHEEVATAWRSVFDSITD